jgi:hypothetical protein
MTQWDESMKQRLLVMNGQRLVQSEQAGQWSTIKVERAGTIKPGIYHIHLAVAPDKSTVYDGLILHADQVFIYQQVGKVLVKHSQVDFDKAPEIASNIRVKYEKGMAVVAQFVPKLGRRIS